MIEDFGIEHYETTDRDTIKIRCTDFQKMLDGSINKAYVNNLLSSTGRFYSHEYI